MTNTFYDAEGVTPGVEIASGGGLTVVKGGAGSFQATTTNPIRGQQSYLVTYGATADTITIIETQLSNTTQQKIAMELTFDAAPTADTPLFTYYATSGGGCCTCTLRATGRVQFADANGTTQYVTPATGGVITFPRTFTIDSTIDIGSSITTGRLQAAVYLHDVSTTAAWQSSGEMTGLDLFKSGALGARRFGKLSGSAVGAHRLDSIRLSDGYGLQGVYAVPTLPVSSVIDSTGWTAQGGTTILANLNDADPNTGATATNPANLALRLQMPGIVPPSGNFTVIVDGVRGGGSTTGAVSAGLYSGGTLLASSDTKVPGTSTTSMTLTWSAASIAGITAGQWASGLELRLVGSAS